MKRTIILGLLLAGLVLAGMGGCSKPPGQAEYDRGLYELKRGNAVRAKSLLEKSITRRPGSEENALAYNCLGVACWQLGQFQTAQEAFEDSRRLGPKLMEPVMNLGLLVASSGDQIRAVKLLEEAARLDARDTRALEHMAQLYAERQQWPEALRMSYAALDRAPDSARILTAIANVQLAAQGPQKAIETLVQALDKSSRYAPALFNLALIYDTKLQDGPHARSYYRRFLSASSKGVQADYARRAVERLSKPEAPPPATEAPILAPDASSHVEASAPVALPATPPEATVDPVLLLVRRAAVLVERGDAAGALTLLSEAATTAGREGRAAEQERLLRDASRLCFDEPRAHYALGQLLLAQNKPEAALNAFKQATVLDRNFALAHLALAHAALQTGETDAALVGFQAAVRSDPKNPDALWELAQLLDVKLKNAELAGPVYRDFERLFPRDPRVLQATARAKALAAAVRPPAAPARVETLRVSAPSTPTPGSVAPPVVLTPRESAPTPVRPVEAPRVVRPARQVPYKAPLTPNPRAASLAFKQGAQYQQQGKWESAIYYYLRSLENDDRLGTTFYNLGSAYAARGEAELAKDAYLRALELQPDLVSARYNLALLYYQSREGTSAETLLREVVRQRPDYAAAHYTLGVIYAANPATLEQARAAYQRYLQLAPNEPSAAVVRQWLSAQ